MAIAKGVALGPYEIVTRIGEGGMGEVWRARDRRIGRDVAVKVLGESFTAGDQRVLRFEQEARAAGALNHPGLVTIFDVGTTDGSPYIVMELLEGQTLRDAIGEIEPSPIPFRKTIDWAIQIASALAVAHEKGIIHRDLKPENIFITSDGRVKILDFGLAKLAEGTSSGEQSGRTAVRHLTSAGIVVGTPGYMSPEQVRAQPLDHRTDIFSLGSVLYEMLTGRPAFDCFSAVETMHAVLNVEPPDLTSIDPKIPSSLDAIVRHCLEKNPRDRFQSARDLAFQLRMLPDMQATVSDLRAALPAPSARRVPYRAAIAAAVALLLLGTGGFVWMRALAKDQGAASAGTFKQLTFGDGVEMHSTLAPDGKSFAYVSSQSGNRDIYVQRVDGRTAINVTSDSPADDTEPAFSPDGSQIAFHSHRDGGGIFVMGVTGESVRRLTDFGHNPAWSPDGTRIVFGTARIELQPRSRSNYSELWVVDARTTEKRPLIQPRKGGPDFGVESDAVQPSWSPDGKRIAFWSRSNAFEHRDIWTIEADAPEPKRTAQRITADAAVDWNPVWSHDGRYLYFGSDRDGTMNLWRIAIDPGSGKPEGVPERVSLPASFTGHYSIAQKGEIAYTTITRSYRLLALPFDMTTGATGEPRTVFEGSLLTSSYAPSPDGQSIAFTTGGAQEDLFIVNADGTRMRQLTNDGVTDRGVAWSPDGKTLLFYGNRDGSHHIWKIGADGSSLARVTSDADLRQCGGKNFYSPELSPDAQTLLVQCEAATGIVHLRRPDGRRFEKLELAGPANGVFPSWSPDGKRMVAMRRGEGDGPLVIPGALVYSLESRRAEMLLDSGFWPQWLPDGRRVLFFEKDSIGIIDVETRQVTTAPFKPLPGVRLDDVFSYYPRISSDGSTIYVRQNLEQGDIWMLSY